MYDELRAWKDEDYRDEIVFDLAQHPAGQVDLSAIGGSAAPITSGGLCISILYSCFPGSVCDICTTVNCYAALAESRF
jgi:hypothetical protein